MRAAFVRLVIGLLILRGLFLVGCGRTEIAGPQTVPVEGKVVFTKGGKVESLSDRGVGIQLESLDQVGVQAFGVIDEDGSFSVATQTEQGAKPGAVPGTHRVRLNADESGARLVAPQLLDYATSGIKITVPSEQPIEIKVWR